MGPESSEVASPLFEPRSSMIGRFTRPPAGYYYLSGGPAHALLLLI